MANIKYYQQLYYNRQPYWQLGTKKQHNSTKLTIWYSTTTSETNDNNSTRAGHRVECYVCKGWLIGVFEIVHCWEDYFIKFCSLGIRWNVLYVDGQNNNNTIKMIIRTSGCRSRYATYILHNTLWWQNYESIETSSNTFYICVWFVSMVQKSSRLWKMALSRP